MDDEDEFARLLLQLMLADSEQQGDEFEDELLASSTLSGDSDKGRVPLMDHDRDEEDFVHLLQLMLAEQQGVGR